VAPTSSTETFAALKLHIENWRWTGVPIYLRSGKRLWKRGTEIADQFRKPPGAVFRETPAAAHLEANQLVSHITPDQGIEFPNQAMSAGPTMQLQTVNMRFNYGEAFEASRGTGYEVMIYTCMTGDSTLFSRTDLVEAAWRIVQPVLDHWAADVPTDFPNYPAGSWGPKAAFDLIERDARRWLQTINRDALQKVPLFQSCSPAFLNSLAMMLEPTVYAAGEDIIRRGEMGTRMYVVNRGEVDILGDDGAVMDTLVDGSFFGELALLLSEPRNATVRARTACDVFVLERAEFDRVLRSHPDLASTILETAKQRYAMGEE